MTGHSLSRFKALNSVVALGLALLLSAAFLWGSAFAQYVPPGAQAVLTVSPATPTVGSTAELRCNIADQQSRPLANQDVTFTIVSQPGTDASVGSTTVTRRTNAQGVATATLTVGSRSGNVVVECRVGQVASRVTVQVQAPPAALPRTGTGLESDSPTSWQPALLILLGMAIIGAVGWRVRSDGFRLR